MSSPRIVFHAKLFVGILFSILEPLVLAASSPRHVQPRSLLQLQDTRVGLDRSDVFIDSMIKAEQGSGQPTESESMEFLQRTIGKFQDFAKESAAAVEVRHKGEEARLEGALGMTKDQGTQLALQQSVTSNAESLLETRRVYNNMVKFASSMQKFLKGATQGGSGCEQVVCGSHASCTESTLGAECVCNEGYVGTGRDCVAPPEFMPHHLLFEGKGTQQTQVKDVHVTIFSQNDIAVVFTDVTRSGMGRIVVGSVREAGMAILAPPEPFTVPGTHAFSPIVAGTEDRRIVVVWRDQNKDGLCWMRGAAQGTTKIRGAEQHLEWGEPVNFCRSQSHKMAIVAVPGNRVIVLYPEEVKAKQHTPAEYFGNSMLLEVSKSGGVASVGQFRFINYAVCRLEVTKLTPKTFVVAARAGTASDEMDSSIHTRQEAMAIYGEISGDDLVFNPNPVNLEPNGKNIWARGISLIAPNTVAYAYQRGTDQKMMLGVLHVNETTHRMKVVHKPTMIREGYSPYVSMISLPYTGSDPHTLTYYDGEKNSMINVCSWDPVRHSLNQCEDFMWVQGKLKSVSGVHLGGGKSFMVFTPESGLPYYGVFGLSKK